MNKGLKNFVIAACICIGIGLLLLIGGVTIGGIDLSKGVVVNQLGLHKLPFTLKINADGDTGIFSFSDEEDDWDEMEDSENFENPEQYQFSMDELKNLDVDFDAGELVIEETTKNDIEVQCVGNVDVELEKGNLEVVCNVTPFHLSHKNRVKILVPQEMEWNEVEIEVDAGKVKLKDIQCREFELDLSAGQVLLNSLQCENSEIKMDAGQITVQEAVTGTMETDVAMGSFIYSGSIQKDCKVHLDAGNLIMHVKEPEEYYNYKVNADLGSIIVGENTYSQTTNAKKENEVAKANMDLDCNLGSICIEFNK